MAEQLAKVLGDLQARRGPDVVHRIFVPKHWLGARATIEVTLPRNLACAACSGGGCDACARAGALSLRDRGAPAEVVTVSLSGGGPGDKEMCLRLAEQGGFALEADLPRGHLLLFVQTGDTPSPDVCRVEKLGAAPGRVADRRLIVRMALGTVALFLLFLAMLRLSGWL